MNKKTWFFFNIFVLMFSTVLVFLFHLIAIASPYIAIPDIPKHVWLAVLAVGYSIGIFLITFSVYRLYKMTEVKIAS